MSIALLQKYLPENTLPFLKNWFGEFYIHIKITRNRNSKLGDYRKLPDKSHQITVNSTLPSELFFFVLTHELAHLIAFEKYGFRISSHGNEWKNTFREMLLESIGVYSQDLKPAILKFSKSPKANFMSSSELVKYFHFNDKNKNQNLIENIPPGSDFIYKKEKYRLVEKRKKNYLCRNLNTGKSYIFKPAVAVEKP
ncbi:MAG: transcription elongation protein SprT [Flavobacteriaceae bacterium]|jgi:hypothetical protein|nr:transcription elongation protein SprT [Flavobacteriaceae bacterium]